MKIVFIDNPDYNKSSLFADRVQHKKETVEHIDKRSNAIAQIDPLKTDSRLYPHLHHHAYIRSNITINDSNNYSKSANEITRDFISL